MLSRNHDVLETDCDRSSCQEANEAFADGLGTYSFYPAYTTMSCMWEVSAVSLTNIYRACSISCAQLLKIVLWRADVRGQAFKDMVHNALFVDSIGLTRQINEGRCLCRGGYAHHFSLHGIERFILARQYCVLVTVAKPTSGSSWGPSRYVAQKRKAVRPECTGDFDFTESRGSRFHASDIVVVHVFNLDTVDHVHDQRGEDPRMPL